ncbi:tryptophan 7-halogenase [Saccharophagus degradans]|uniref:tryptophan halogenase family protein n=1 Tax=Saccharophagus degradans TaxID=86304 RepID=UPI002478096B|nr:tryptophan halogenase family protein [Saccharophagus degradans]WGO97459.1 tryptophan 7-halogenase [Saccharophagus degradans]
MSKEIKRVVVVGGGSAGWLTAGIIAAEFSPRKENRIQVILIESPDVPTIGVGEGTWPTMRTTLQQIGLSETDFFRSCNASFKQGSKFVGWRDGGGNDAYYHPFTLPAGYGDVNVHAVWRSTFPDKEFSEAMCLQTIICEKGLGPKQHTMPEFAGALNYGYHLDAAKFVELLKGHCTRKLGVEHILDNVININSAPNGDISSLTTQSSGSLAGDIFIDCTGSASLLLGQHFKIPFLEQSKYSINDRAIAAQIPYGDESHPIASATISTAQSAGWVWDIALSNRRGTGYVYSSAHISDEAAELEFRKYLALSIGHKAAESLPARQLTFNAGYRQKFWQKNCVAVGMSAGFIEPLEASALALVELGANMIRDELSVSHAEIDIIAKRFNSVFTYRWEKIIEFLKLHYVLTKRTDSDYWKDVVHPDSIPDKLKELLAIWKYRSPNHNDFLHAEEVFPSASYQYILYGMGFETNTLGNERASDNIQAGIYTAKQAMNNAAKYIAHLQPNRELLSNIYSFGMQKI